MIPNSGLLPGQSASTTARRAGLPVPPAMSRAKPLRCSRRASGLRAKRARLRSMSRSSMAAMPLALMRSVQSVAMRGKMR